MTILPAKPGPAESLLGHPRGMVFIVGAEAMDAFSFYGMQALLVLYMTKYLLLPAHAGHVAGLAWLRGALESLHGPLSTNAFASAIQGLYAGFAYLTPVAGGFLADRVLGRTRTIILGAALMSVGHFLMAFEASFLPALIFLLLGLGCFGSNIATQLGELYDVGDPRRADAFQLFSLGVSATVIVSPVICGVLAEKYAWHWGFTVAGIGMLLGLCLYLAGLSWMPAPPRPARLPRAARARMAAGEARAVLALVLLLPALSLAMLGNQEIFNAYIIWGEATYNLVFFGTSMPVSWLVSLDAFLGAGIAVLVLMFWRWWDRHYRPVDEITRVIIGAFMMAAAPLTLALASSEFAASGRRLGACLSHHQQHRFREFLSRGAVAVFTRSATGARRADDGGLQDAFICHQSFGRFPGRFARPDRCHTVLAHACRAGGWRRAFAAARQIRLRRCLGTNATPVAVSARQAVLF
jgi:POT family proton-dependent oligopeptide transporter